MSPSEYIYRGRKIKTAVNFVREYNERVENSIADRNKVNLRKEVYYE